MDLAAQSHLNSTLDQLATGLSGGVGRFWVGPKPIGDPAITIIVAKVGLDARDRVADFHPVSTDDAPIWLTLFATQSLLHGGEAVPTDTLESVSNCLRMLGSDAKFFSKGVWQQTRRFKIYEAVSSKSGWAKRRHRTLFQASGDPLPPIDVLVDGGMIGFNDSIAFVFLGRRGRLTAKLTLLTRLAQAYDLYSSVWSESCFQQSVSTSECQLSAPSRPKPD